MPYRRPSPAHARRQLATARATLASWEAAQPTDWRSRADQHQAVRKWTLEVMRWERVLGKA